MIGTSNFTAASELKPICGDLLWRQIYPPKRRDLLDHHVARARDLGIRVIVITLESPMVGNREYMRRSGWGSFRLTASSFRQMIASPHWLWGTLLRYLLKGGLPEIADMPAGETKFYKGTGSWANTADPGEASIEAVQPGGAIPARLARLKRHSPMPGATLRGPWGRTAFHGHERTRLMAENAGLGSIRAPLERVTFGQPRTDRGVGFCVQREVDDQKRRNEMR